ncbi:MAG: hypothetical protein IJ562_12390 [Prevotella sp.]|nr:hypothetical protein [Prevotella sp.]
MKRILVPFAILVTTIIVCASCLGDDEEDYTYYDDTAITTFSLGTLNRYVHTTSSTGSDSIYKTTVTGSNYKFMIDHEKREIYNPDSLPLGTDAAHVICTVAAKNSGLVTIKSLTSDSLKYYSESDSVDFTSPREFVVYSNSGKANRTYTVHVNVHQEDGDAFNWTMTNSNAPFTGLQAVKGFALSDGNYVFGFNGESTVMYKNTGNSWIAESDTWDAMAYKNVVKTGDRLYLLDKGTLAKIGGGSISSIATGIQLQRLIGAGMNSLYGIDAENNLVVSHDEGSTWTAENLDDSSALLPADNISCAVISSRTNNDIYRVVICGNRSLDTYPDDAYGMVWGKIEETSGNAMIHDWTYYKISVDNLYGLPRLKNLAMAAYGDGLIALGNEGIGKCTYESMDYIYESLDGGITWKKSSTYPLPNELKGSGLPFTAFTDDSNYLWIVSTNGQTWRGRLNKLGWTSEQRSFME